MGYCHHWCVGDIEPLRFELIVSDMKKLIPHLPNLCNVDGVGEPTFSDSLIEFNGDIECGHKEESMYKDYDGLNMSIKETQEWYKARPCFGEGDCSHEPFMLACKRLDWDMTKTNRKPYDLAVMSCLIIAKHYLGGKLEIGTDGTMEDWNPARELCMLRLGYCDMPCELDAE